MIIEWRSIPDFPDYEVSNTGLVRSYKRGGPHILKPGKHPSGYHQVGLRRNDKTHIFPIGHLVLFTFQGPCPIGCEMCHNDGNPTNDHIDNLRWDTHAANMQDASNHGVARRIQSRDLEEMDNGVFINTVEITQKASGMTQREFAEYIRVSQATLSKFYSRGVKGGIIVKILRKYPHLAYYF